MLALPLPPADVALAQALLDARRERRAIPHFPGAVPATPEAAYAVQAHAVAGWGEAIVGWKVGRFAPDLGARFGVERFMGPLFASAVRTVEGEADFPIIPGGSAAFEAELVFVVGEGEEIAPGVPPIARVHIGVEVAGSPVADLPGLGALASIADFGNTNGLLIGPEVAAPASGDWADVQCTTLIDGAKVGEGLAARLPGGPMAGWRFAATLARALGQPLQPGQVVATGAITGVHAFGLGQVAQATFVPGGQIACRGVPLA